MSAPLNDVVLLAARALLASVFIVSAIDKLAGAPPEIKAIQSLHLPAPAFLERFAGICEVVGAAMLILGVGARSGAALLALFTLFVTFAFLRFWSFAGPAEARQGQKSAFFGNFGVIGGLLFVIGSGPGALALGSAY